MSYRIAGAARSDIRQITRYIRTVQKSPENAKLVATRLTAHFKLLARMPGIGHRRPEIRDDSVRVSTVSGLLVVYDPNTRPLLILRVIHPGRDLGSIPLKG